MSAAFIFGFLHLFVEVPGYNFERLHVFLFNLCSGGTIILFFTEDSNKLTGKTTLFLCLSIAYAALAFFKIYIPAMVISIVLAFIVETVRIKKFSILPLSFFSRKEPVFKKFHQASLLCLSMGLIISCAVILNNEYLKIISMPKLKLDTFFLGFSFPLSLITMSVIFSLMADYRKPVMRTLKEIGFWNINLGVIIFFVFIIFEKLAPQVVVTTILFFTVIMIFWLYYKLGKDLQQKNFLTSGIGFLVVTAITGIAYILLEILPGYTAEKYRWLLWLHSFASLYGWNLCGLAVICRFDDFPVRLHSGSTIALHWITALIFAPLGKYYSLFAVLSVLCYSIILGVILFSKTSNTSSTSPTNQTN